MKISFSTLSCPDWSWDRILTEASRLGFDGIEIRGVEGEMYLPSAKPFLEANLEGTLAQLASTGLEVVGLGSSVCFHDPESHGEFLAEGKAYLDLAVRMGVPYVRVFGDRIPDPAHRIETVERISEGFRALCDHAMGTPVELLFETHGDFNDAESVLSVLDRVDRPNLGILWDIEHTFKFYGDDVTGFLERTRNRIRHVHVKDVRRTHEGFTACRVGEGDVPVARIVRLLDGIGYEGYLSLEWEKKWHPELEEPEFVLPAYIETMRYLS